MIQISWNIEESLNIKHWPMTKFVCCCSNFFGFPRHEQFACVSPWASSPWPVCVGSTSRMWIQRMALAARWWWLLKWENIRVISLENICSCYPQWHREHPPSFPAQSWAPYLHNLMSNIYWNIVILTLFEGGGAFSAPPISYLVLRQIFLNTKNLRFLDFYPTCMTVHLPPFPAS